MSVWDIILQSPEEAYLDFPEEHVEYPFMDQVRSATLRSHNLAGIWAVVFASCAAICASCAAIGDSSVLAQGRACMLHP